MIYLIQRYSCLKRYSYKRGEYSLTTIRKDDILKIKEWRNEQISVLRQSVYLTNEDQINYYERNVEPTFSLSNPKIILLSYLKDAECIGYGGLTNIDWQNKRAEVSFLISTIRAQDDKLYIQEFSTFLQLIKSIAYNDLELARLYTETYDIRPLHISILVENGFSFEGRMKNHIIIEGKPHDSLIHGNLKEEEANV